MLAKKTSEYTEKLKSFESIEKQLKEKERIIAEKEEAQMSEFEKLQSKLNKTLEHNKTLEKMLDEKEMGIVTSSVLADPKYAPLPQVYKRGIPLSKDKDEVQKAADAMLAQFQADFERSTGKKSTPVIDSVKADAKQVTAARSARALHDKKKRFGLFY